MNIYDRIIETGIIGLLIYMPLSYGSVMPGSITFLEIVAGFLLLVWLIKLVIYRKKAFKIVPSRDAKHPVLMICVLSLLVIFSLFIFLQFVPLPRSLVKIISPATYSLYEESAALLEITLPELLPLSVCRQATETEFYVLGKYLYRFLPEDSQDSVSIQSKKDSIYHEVEGHLQKAILLDPANPLYYYEMGFLSYTKGECQGDSFNNWRECSITRYFEAALSNAPKSLSLRTAVGQWYALFDHDVAVQRVREMLAQDLNTSMV